MRNNMAMYYLYDFAPGNHIAYCLPITGLFLNVFAINMLILV